ncbi:MAG: hypothetical protein ABI688_06565 [Bacteroidota bacterium]
MEICFTRNNNKQHIISCRRNNGTDTWMRSEPFFIVHDLCHYAVESVLSFKHAFYGMLAAGTDINDFELPKEERTFQLSDQAIAAEQIVNLLTIEYSQGRLENFLGTLNEIPGKQAAMAVSLLKADDLEEIRESFTMLMDQWQLLPDGKTMTLLFEE